jgi:hypothetical protein
LDAPASSAQWFAAAAGPFAGKGAMNRQIVGIPGLRVLADAIALWAGHGRAAGKSDQEMYRRFWFWHGVDVLTALTLPRDEMESMTSEIQRHV